MFTLAPCQENEKDKRARAKLLGERKQGKEREQRDPFKKQLNVS